MRLKIENPTNSCTLALQDTFPRLSTLSEINPIRANPLHPTFIDTTSRIKYIDCGEIIS